MISNENIHELLQRIFKKWIKYNRRFYFKHQVDDDEIFNTILLLDQHLIDDKNVFSKWKKKYSDLNDARQFEFYMGTVFRNSIMQMFRNESAKLKTVSGEYADSKIDDTPEKTDNVITSFEIEDLCEEISQLLSIDMEKNSELRKVLRLVSLYYLEELSLEKISRATGLNTSFVYRQIQKGLIYLKSKISEAAKAIEGEDVKSLFKENEKKIFARVISSVLSEQSFKRKL